MICNWCRWIRSAISADDFTVLQDKLRSLTYSCVPTWIRKHSRGHMGIIIQNRSVTPSQSPLTGSAQTTRTVIIRVAANICSVYCYLKRCHVIFFVCFIASHKNRQMWSASRVHPATEYRMEFAMYRKLFWGNFHSGISSVHWIVLINIKLCIAFMKDLHCNLITD